eukprot:481613_1
MRVMYIHAGKRINKDLKSDDYHVDLFRDRLRLRFEVPSHRNAMQNLLLDSQSSLQMIERLPRGQILGVAIFDATYWFDPSKHMADPWCLGPFCYQICDSFRFERGVDASGQLGIWTPTQHAQNEILSQPSVRNKLEEWKQRYGNRLYFGKDPNGTPSAITILQPFVEAILCGAKKVENRKRPCFRLHHSAVLYKHPKAPDPTQCRFCPSDGTKCASWVHVTDDSSRKRRLRNHSKVTTPPSESDEEEDDDDDDDDVNLSETEEDYSSEEEYKREYNTRSRRKSYEALMASHNMKSEREELMHFNHENKKNRKRKRSEVSELDLNGAVNESPPNKKHKRDKKERKKHKKRKKKKKYDRHKWKSFKTELRFGEDGESPLRMCWHGSLMQPEPNPLSNPRDCHVCEETISWDQYYHCDCNGIRTDWCYSHTRKLCIPSPRGWKYVAECVQRCNVIQRNAMVECLAIPLSYIKKHKKKSKKRNNRVGVDRKKNDDAAITPDVKLCFDPTKMAASFKPSAGVSAPPAPIAPPPPPQHAATMGAFKRLPITLNLDPRAIQRSINVVRHKQEQTHTNGFVTQRAVGRPKMDFSQFPAHLTPTIPNGHVPTPMAFNIDPIAINQTQPQSIKPQPTQQQHSLSQPQPPRAVTHTKSGHVLSLSQIFSNMSNPNNHTKVTPVPSPFAPSPSPTHNNSNNNTNTNGASMQNVHALQSLLNRPNRTTNNQYNIAGYNVNIQSQTPQQIRNNTVLPVNPNNPNPFGPVSTSTSNNNTSSSENTTENTTTTNTASTSSNTQLKPSIWNQTEPQIASSNTNNVNTNSNHTMNPIKTAPAAPYHYGVIPPSYQTMQQRAMPYVQVPVPAAAAPNGQMVYMVPPQGYQYGLQPFYQYHPYNAQQPNKQQHAMPVPVPVQQT